MNARAGGRGRPRDGSIDADVIEAVGAVLDGEGFHAVSIQDVARRAGVSKAAIYRRWPDRERLALDALRARIGPVSVPASGCTLCDLHDALRFTTEVYCSLGAGTLAQLLGESAVDPTLRTELLGVVIDPIRGVVAEVLSRARQRGELRADADLPLSVDTLCAVVFHRLLLDQNPLSSDQLLILISHTLRGIADRPEELVRQFEDQATGHDHDESEASHG